MSLKESVKEIVEQMSPPANAVGVLTADEMRRVIEEAVNRGAMAGWACAMRTNQSVQKQKQISLDAAPTAWIGENGVGFKYLRWKKPGNVHVPPVPLYKKSASPNE